MSRAVPWPMLTAESGSDHYFKDIQRFPMLDPQEEYMLAKRWREAGDRDAPSARRLRCRHRRECLTLTRSGHQFFVLKLVGPLFYHCAGCHRTNGTSRQMFVQ